MGINWDSAWHWSEWHWIFIAIVGICIGFIADDVRRIRRMLERLLIQLGQIQDAQMRQNRRTD